MRTIAFHNLGCKVNSYETDYMEQKSIENGYEIVKFEQKAPPKKRSAEKKFICWYSRLFEINEFYHIYGIPGICFHGYLPKNEFGEPEFDCYEPSYGYYDFKIRDLEHFKKILEAMKKADVFLHKQTKRAATILRTTNPSNCPTKIPPQPTFFADVII